MKLHDFAIFLGARLERKNDLEASTLCYMCSGNLRKTLDAWLKDTTDTKSLQDLIEKITIFKHAVDDQEIPTELVNKYAQYADILASQGILSVALDYLTIVGFERLNPHSLILVDRIYGARKMHNASYPFPFQKVEVGVAAIISKPDILPVENIVNPNVFPVITEVNRPPPKVESLPVDTGILNTHTSKSVSPILLIPGEFTNKPAPIPVLTQETRLLAKELSTEAKAIIDILSSILVALINQLLPTDPRRKIADDGSKRLNELFQKLTKNDIPPAHVTKLHQITICIASGDYLGADTLTKQYWNELGSHTLLGLRRLIDIALKK